MVHGIRGRGVRLCIRIWSNQMCVATRRDMELTADGLPQRSSCWQQESSWSYDAKSIGKFDSFHRLRMTAAAKEAALAQIGGADLKHFVTQSVLLSLIDPVRGVPTRTSLDENPDGDISGGQQLKQKSLDSFALICSTSSEGAKTASAVCLEQHAPDGAILRVARNCGLTPQDLAGLDNVLQILQVVARKGTDLIRNLLKATNAACDAEKSSTQAESELLRIVVELDRGRILSLAEKAKKGGIQNFLQQARSMLLSGQAKPETSAKPGLRLWLESCPFTTAPSQTWSSESMVMLIDWASQARWLYPEQLQTFLRLDDTQKPPWLDSLHKIARYHNAVKTMLKLAAKQPEILAGACIREVKAPNSRPFSLSNEKAPLLTTVKYLVRKDSRTIMEQLERHFNTQDAEAQLRRASRLQLTLHAEMFLSRISMLNKALTVALLRLLSG